MPVNSKGIGALFLQGNYRWRITALLFFATTINYLDRSVLSILAPKLQLAYSWTETDYGHIVMSFQVAYGAGVLFAGKLLDKLGSRIVYSLAIIIWSLAGVSHALARTVFQFSLARFFLGLGESANFPAAVKTVTEWFPQKERALATGIFNAGSTIGAIAAPALVPWLAIHYGWQSAFIVTGCLGFVWVICWIKNYSLPAQHKKVTHEELAYIQSGNEPVQPAMSWWQVLGRRETIALCLARFCTDPVWWFLLYWLPKFLDKQYHVELGNVGLPLIIIYTAADLGGIAGGWFSSRLIKKGNSARRSRSIAMFICALCVVPVAIIATGPGLWTSVLLISLACAAHQGWAANIFTVASDVFPSNAVASVTGISTCAAVIGSTLASIAIGSILDKTGSYALIFSVAACMYVVAWIILRTMIPGKRHAALPI